MYKQAHMQPLMPAQCECNSRFSSEARTCQRELAIGAWKASRSCLSNKQCYRPTDCIPLVSKTGCLKIGKTFPRLTYLDFC
uniref:Uncharacterized protein n=1 Tax=Anguilla anguilla TaxID=7936 RepID=A0A0E9RRM7_ANGAN